MAWQHMVAHMQGLAMSGLATARHGTARHGGTMACHAWSSSACVQPALPNMPWHYLVQHGAPHVTVCGHGMAWHMPVAARNAWRVPPHLHVHMRDSGCSGGQCTCAGHRLVDGGCGGGLCGWQWAPPAARPRGRDGEGGEVAGHLRQRGAPVLANQLVGWWGMGRGGLFAEDGSCKWRQAQAEAQPTHMPHAQPAAATTPHHMLAHLCARALFKAEHRPAAPSPSHVLCVRLGRPGSREDGPQQLWLQGACHGAGAAAAPERCGGGGAGRCDGARRLMGSPPAGPAARRDCAAVREAAWRRKRAAPSAASYREACRAELLPWRTEETRKRGADHPARLRSHWAPCRRRDRQLGPNAGSIMGSVHTPVLPRLSVHY